MGALAISAFTAARLFPSKGDTVGAMSVKEWMSEKGLHNFEDVMTVSGHLDAWTTGHLETHVDQPRGNELGVHRGALRQFGWTFRCGATFVAETPLGSLVIEDTDAAGSCVTAAPTTSMLNPWMQVVPCMVCIFSVGIYTVLFGTACVIYWCGRAEAEGDLVSLIAASVGIVVSTTAAAMGCAILSPAMLLFTRRFGLAPHLPMFHLRQTQNYDLFGLLFYILIAVGYSLYFILLTWLLLPSGGHVPKRFPMGTVGHEHVPRDRVFLVSTHLSILLVASVQVTLLAITQAWHMACSYRSAVLQMRSQDENLWIR